MSLNQYSLLTLRLLPFLIQSFSLSFILSLPPSPFSLPSLSPNLSLLVLSFILSLMLSLFSSPFSLPSLSSLLFLLFSLCPFLHPLFLTLSSHPLTFCSLSPSSSLPYSLSLKPLFHFLFPFSFTSSLFSLLPPSPPFLLTNSLRPVSPPASLNFIFS